MDSVKKSIIWQGTPSHYSNLDSYLFWSVELIVTLVFLNITGFYHYITDINYFALQDILSLSDIPSALISMSIAILLIFPIGKLLSFYLTIRNTNYQLTEERIITSTGIINRSHDELELYRIKDYQVEEPFFQRLFSLGTIVLETSDKSHPVLNLSAVKDPKAIRDIIRERVEILRTSKGVREIDH